MRKKQNLKENFKKKTLNFKTFKFSFKGKLL